MLATYVCCYGSKLICAESLVQLYILPTDSDTYPQNKCYTLNELIESYSSLKQFINETTFALLPGVHVVNTTRVRPTWIKGEQKVGLVIEDAESIVFTSISDKTTVW